MTVFFCIFTVAKKGESGLEEAFFCSVLSGCRSCSGATFCDQLSFEMKALHLKSDEKVGWGWVGRGRGSTPD
jgi:hypothetical protein